MKITRLVLVKALSGEGYKGHSFLGYRDIYFPIFPDGRTEDGKEPFWNSVIRDCTVQERKQSKMVTKEPCTPWEAAWVSDGEVTPYVTGVNVHTGEPMICLTG